jgi:signal transduction histidine kinase
MGIILFNRTTSGQSEDNKEILSHALGVKNDDFKRSQDEFLSIASHELRTPLTAIKGNTSLIRQYFWEQLPSDELRQMVTDIDRASDRMLKMINSFLDTLRLEQKLVKFEVQNFDVVPLAAEVVKDLKAHSKHDVHLNFKGTESHLTHVYSDKKWIKHALQNLLDNALKFTERGNVTVSALQDGNFIKIIITDTGLGIPQKSREIIFNKFAQTSGDILTRETTQGTGLGLYMARLIMEQLGGSAQLEYSEPGAGSTFSISIPCAK